LRRSGSDPDDAKHSAQQQTVRYLMVASYRGEVPPGYRDVAEGEVVCIDRDLCVNRQSL
jgi:hypothetical protein